MDRPIKFRAWVLNDHGDWMAQQGVHHEIDTASKFLALYGEDILMQYTGLHDKNGTEIYEGDIIEVSNDESIEGVDCGIGEVEFLDDWGIWYVNRVHHGLGDLYHIRDLKVIGNIYQHPELLEGVADGS